jgi:transposase
MQNETEAIIAVKNPDSAGIDISSRDHFVSIPEGRDKQCVRQFGGYTEDLKEIVKWLKQCRIKTVAMESTGIYWLQLFLMLEEAGFEVYLVNSRHVKNVSGRKTDELDCQWIQKLHSYGLLSNSFQPDMITRELREYVRQRKNLIRDSSSHILRMQKSMEMMNIKLHNVISDITGKSGIQIIEAILGGDHNPENLIKLVDIRVKASHEEIKKSLEGTWRTEHLFELKQAYDLYKYYLQKIAECDIEIEKVLSKQIVGQERKETDKKKVVRKQKNSPKFDLSQYLTTIFGVDITEIFGLSCLSGLEILSEVGTDMSKWKTSGHFVSWLGLAPNNRISGGKILSSRVPKTKNRAGQVFRMGANSLWNAKNALGDFYRRIKSRSGPAKAVIATARKIAIIFYNMVSKQIDFTPIALEEYQEYYKAKKIKYLEKQLKIFGMVAMPALN